MSNIQMIEEKITTFIKSSAAIAPGFMLTKETLLFEEGLFDSMGFMSLINFLQQDMKIQPADEDLVIENFESINAIVNYISKKQNI
jgi:acyl carrier protein